MLVDPFWQAPTQNWMSDARHISGLPSKIPLLSNFASQIHDER
jgi:hypothetical protein